MEIKKAKEYTHFILKISVLFAALISLSIFILRRQIALFYTDIESVISLTEISLSYLALIHLFDFNYTVLQGIFRALTKFTHNFVLVFILFYIVGLPLSAVLTFKL